MTRELGPPPRLSASVVGTAGVYWVCYQLTLRGLIAVPTSRNAKSVDVLVTNAGGGAVKALQIKSRTGAASWPVGRAREDGLDAQSLCPIDPGPEFYYAFVTLRSDSQPEAILVHSADVQRRVTEVIQRQLDLGRPPHKVFPAFDLPKGDERNERYRPWRGISSAQLHRPSRAQAHRSISVPRRVMLLIVAAFAIARRGGTGAAAGTRG